MPDAVIKRAKDFREMAERANQLAAKSKGEARVAYLELAQQWKKLALFAEETDMRCRGIGGQAHAREQGEAMHSPATTDA